VTRDSSAKFISDSSRVPGEIELLSSGLDNSGFALFPDLASRALVHLEATSSGHAHVASLQIQHVKETFFHRSI
jgi:hypothetical protein